MPILLTLSTLYIQPSAQQPRSGNELRSSVDNNRPAQARLWCAQHGYVDYDTKKMSCVAATHRADYIAATQLGFSIYRRKPMAARTKGALAYRLLEVV